VQQYSTKDTEIQKFVSGSTNNDIVYVHKQQSQILHSLHVNVNVQNVYYIMDFFVSQGVM
jgi:hypothetical protein